MARRNYSNTAVDTTLNGTITSGASSLIATSASGYPTAPFLIVIDPDTASEELILAGAKSGTTFSSLTRGVDGTSAAGHSSGAVIRHVVSATDIDDFDGHRWDSPATAADTDVATSSIHHTLGLTSTKAAAGDHTHSIAGLVFGGCSIYRNGGYSLTTSGTTYAIPFDSELTDPNGMHTGSSTQIVLNTVGWWLLIGVIGFQSNSTGYREAFFSKNGGISSGTSLLSAVGTANTWVPCHAIIQSTAITDYVELNAVQTSGGSLAIVAGTGSTWAAAHYLGT